jgi:hypothetical protein
MGEDTYNMARTPLVLLSLADNAETRADISPS